MTEKLGQEVAEIGVRLLDGAYLAWFVAESECEQALRAWLDRTPVNGAEAYLAYRAALDREEAAARDLQRLSQLAQPCRDSLAHRNTGETAEAQRAEQS